MSFLLAICCLLRIQDRTLLFQGFEFNECSFAVRLGFVKKEANSVSKADYMRPNQVLGSAAKLAAEMAVVVTHIAV